MIMKTWSFNDKRQESKEFEAWLCVRLCMFSYMGILCPFYFIFVVFLCNFVLDCKKYNQVGYPLVKELVAFCSCVKLIIYVILLCILPKTLKFLYNFMNIVSVLLIIICFPTSFFQLYFKWSFQSYLYIYLYISHPNEWEDWNR